MGNVDLTLSLRPIKLAFLVEPSDKDAVRTSIEISSCLWGGVFNPIVPVFPRKPRNWEWPISPYWKSRNIVDGYLDAYDPDFVVPVGICSKRSWYFSHRRLLQMEDLLPVLDEDFGAGYGISIFEILSFIYEEEFKFKRAEPLHMVFPIIGRQHSLFLQAFFGTLPLDVDDIISQKFDTKIGIQRPNVAVKEFHKYLALDFLFPRRISTWKIRAERHDNFRGGQCVLVLDASNTLDVIDYWNLRAIGWNVVPVPIQVRGQQELRDIVEEFIEENYYPLRNSPNVYHMTTVLRSRNVSENLVREFTESLFLTAPVDNHKGKYALQFWQPRIWDNWARESDGVECCNLMVETRELEVTSSSDDYMSVRTVDPPMIFRHVFSGKPRFANDIGIRNYGYEVDPAAEVFPEGGRELAHSIGAIAPEEWRIGAGGLVYLSRGPNERVLLRLPRSEPVFISWLKQHGWDVKLSSAGRIAKQMLKQVHGIWGVSFLARPRLITLLGKMANGKTLLKRTVQAEVHRIVNEESFGPDAESFLQALTEQNIIRLGLQMQCPVCQQHSWRPLDALDYTITCERCLNAFAVPTHTPDDLKWAYRAHGTFGLPKSSYGVYAVLLTLRFFSRVLRGATTPIMSFTAHRKRQILEADLGIFYQHGMLVVCPINS